MQRKDKKISEVRLSGRGKKIAIVASKFNEFVTKQLLNACREELKKNGVADKDITTMFVPGSLEIPVLALKIAKKKNIDAVICLGAVIKGDTYHFEMVSQGSMQGIMQASLMTEKPVINGILTTYSEDQALKRAELRGDNKGRDAAVTALEMIHLLSQVK